MNRHVDGPPDVPAGSGCAASRALRPGTGRGPAGSRSQRAVSRGWTLRTFPGGHVAQQEDPRGVATLIEKSVQDRNKPPAAN